MPRPRPRTPYHHGDLRAQVLHSAAELAAEAGPESLSLRELARRAGVSHAAPAHHFGDRRGLMTALATEGFHALAEALEPSVAARAFDRTAVAYVRFAVAHSGHFSVMFRSELTDREDPDLRRARARATDLLDQGLSSVPDAGLVIDRLEARRSAWAIVHGIAVLWLDGALPGVDPEQLAIAAARQLFRP